MVSSLILPAALALLLAASVLAEDATSAVPAFTPPPAHYNPDLSFRGLSSHGKVAKFEVSGHACVEPAAIAFLLANISFSTTDKLSQEYTTSSDWCPCATVFPWSLQRQH